MKPATGEALDGEQKTFQGQLDKSVALINEADELLKGDGEIPVRRATALILSAVARAFIVETAARQNMLNRLQAFNCQQN
jgi:hypothetical protein